MNTFTTFTRIYVGLLLGLSFGGSLFLVVEGPGWQQHTALDNLAGVLMIGGYFAFIAALPLLVVVALGWVVCGGLKS